MIILGLRTLKANYLINVWYFQLHTGLSFHESLHMSAQLHQFVYTFEFLDHVNLKTNKLFS